MDKNVVTNHKGEPSHNLIPSIFIFRYRQTVEKGKQAHNYRHAGRNYLNFFNFSM